MAGVYDRHKHIEKAFWQRGLFNRIAGFYPRTHGLPSHGLLKYYSGSGMEFPPVDQFSGPVRSQSLLQQRVHLARQVSIGVGGRLMEGLHPCSCGETTSVLGIDFPCGCFGVTHAHPRVSCGGIYSGLLLGP